LHSGKDGEAIDGQLKVPSRNRRPVTLVWGGDTAGQGFGINEAFGGMKMYSVMQRHQPDLFIHSGDGIYADHPILSELKLPDQSVWRNLVVEEKSKVAESLREFRGNWRYNLIDQNLRSFNGSVAQFVQWDDHETTNNWNPQKVLTDPRYSEKRCDVLSQRSRKAFYEYAPVWVSPEDPLRIYCGLKYGPDVEMFKLDARSFRGANSPNDQGRPSKETAFFGIKQLDWLKVSLLKTTSTWKLILSDMPLGIVIKDGERNFEAVAQENGPAQGRELEIANLLRFIKLNNIRNVVWLTADVHYAAAHYYDPAKAQFQDFNPFWEFIAGPLHAGAYPPGQLDSTFGPQLKFCSTTPSLVPSSAPGPDTQFFGKVRFDPESQALTVSIHSLGDKKLYEVTLLPA
jgi:alkaline phosphatase D